MGQFYTDPSRATDPHALPNAEVFYVDAGEWIYDNRGERLSPFVAAISPSETFTPCEAGWYWWPCFPGCLPDGEPNGPFPTEQDAIANAQEES